MADLKREAARATAADIGALAVATDVGRESEIIDLITIAQEANGPIDLFFLQRRRARARRGSRGP